MKLFYSLPVLAVLVASPAVLSAQAIATAQASMSAASFYTRASQPLSSPSSFIASSSSSTSSSSSSSSANAFLSDGSAQASAPAPAKAEGGSHGPFSGLGADVKIGLNGIGFDVATPLIPYRLNLRGGASFFSYSLSETTSDGLDASGTLKLQNSGIMLDWFPWRGKFRLSGGVTVYNANGFSGSLDVPSGNSFTLGSDKYYASGPVTGNGVFKLGGNTGGRISFGTGNLIPKKGRFTFESELGIEFVSAPTVSLGFTGNVCTSAQGQNCESPENAATYATFLSDVTAEQNKLESDVNFVKFYPIVSIGIGYKLF